MPSYRNRPMMLSALWRMRFPNAVQFRRVGFPGLLLMPLMLLLATAPTPAQAATRALLIGIDDYGRSHRLNGAVADARDLEAALRRTGATDIVVLVNERADRPTVLRTLMDLAARAKPGDLVIVSFAGLGSVLRVSGAPAGEPPDKVLLLTGFDALAAAGSQRILLAELQDAIGALDAAGVSGLAIIDAGFGQDDIRDVDARTTGPLQRRSLPPLMLASTQGVAGRIPGREPHGERRRTGEFTRAMTIEAGGGAFTVLEIQIFGLSGWRGALSYAIARGIEISAARGDPLSPDKLAVYAGQLAYQLSDARQDVTISGPTRGIKQVAGPGMPSRPQLPEPPSAKGKRQGPVVPIAALDGQVEHFKGLAPQETAFVVVAPNQNPVLLWDTAKKDVIVGGDVIARDVTRDDIPAIVDRVVAVRDIKQLTAQAPQPMLVAPSGGTHRQGQKITVEIHDITNRALVLFSIAGNGTVQLLYPIGSDPPIITKSSYRLDLMVQEPFGADQIVAITAPERMSDIENAINRLKNRRSSGQLQNILTHYAPANSRIGSIGIFTAR